MNQCSMRESNAHARRARRLKFRVAASFTNGAWCSPRESDPHAFRHSVLSGACLPVPPGEQSCRRPDSNRDALSGTSSSGWRACQFHHDGIVPRTGVEPARPEGHRVLSAARLPVPPPRRISLKSLQPLPVHGRAAAYVLETPFQATSEERVRLLVRSEVSLRFLSRLSDELVSNDRIRSALFEDVDDERYERMRIRRHESKGRLITMQNANCAQPGDRTRRIVLVEHVCSPAHSPRICGATESRTRPARLSGVRGPPDHLAPCYCRAACSARASRITRMTRRLKSALRSGGHAGTTMPSRSMMIFTRAVISSVLRPPRSSVTGPRSLALGPPSASRTPHAGLIRSRTAPAAGGLSWLDSRRHAVDGCDVGPTVDAAAVVTDQHPCSVASLHEMKKHGAVDFD